ncbi:MAG: hypothetical protein QOF68_2898 [Gaiellales bacterium]|jgi:hypothetical protein|nr:hypothetical protein [Gaiellales bacterium]
MALLTLGEFMWSLLVIYFMVTYFMMLFYVIVDVFRRHELSGVKKAGWLLLLFVLPLIGLISYVAVNGDGAAFRNRERAALAQNEMDDYIRDTAGADGTAGEIERGKRLLDSGAINEAEFAQLKSRALAQGA